MRTAQSLFIALLLTGCVARQQSAPVAPVESEPVLPGLSGVWRGVESTILTVDGSSRKNSMDTCRVVIQGDLTTTACDLPDRQSEITSRMSCVSQNLSRALCEMEIVRDSTGRNPVGTTSKMTYQLEGKRLHVTAYPRAGNSRAANLPMEVVSILERID